MISRATLNSVTSRSVAARPLMSISPPLYWLGAALLLLVLQLLSGTGPVYALLVFALLFATYTGVRWAGGLNTLFGLMIFYLLLQHVLIAQIAKVIFWEPADSTLRRPIETMGVYAVGMASLAIGVRLANRFRFRKQPLLLAETRPSRLFWLSLLCTIFSTALMLAIRTVGASAETGGAVQGGILGPLKQLSLLGPLAIASGTAYLIKSSGGRRSFGLLVGIPIVVQTAIAVVNTAREYIVVPTLIYIVTCIAFRYRFRPKHYAVFLIGGFVANYIIFPYALTARHLHSSSFEKDVSQAGGMLADLLQDPFKYRDQVDQHEAIKSRAESQFDYYRHGSPTLYRYTIIMYVDGIVDATLSRGETEWTTITPGFLASLPRFINPDKPFVNTGNLLSHREPGLILNKKDATTGITLGFFGDAFSSFGWLGISLIPGLIIMSLMTLFRLVVDDRLWGNVLMISLITQLCWTFSEGTIANQIVMCLTAPLVTSVGILTLYILAYALDRMTNRAANVWMPIFYSRHQALHRSGAEHPRT